MPRRRPRPRPRLPRPKPTAAQQALNIAEICEIIFVNLGILDLLVSINRVSKLWHKIVNNTPVLRQILHFDPIPKPLVHGPVNKDGRDPRLELVPNPLLYKLLSASIDKLYWRDDEGLAPPTAVTTWSRTKPDRSRRPFKPRPSITRATSWRRMLVSQPPPPHLCFVRKETHREDLESRVQAADPGGLRMGQLHDMLVIWALRRPKHEIHTFWNHVPLGSSVPSSWWARRYVADAGFVVVICPPVPRIPSLMYMSRLPLSILRRAICLARREVNSYPISGYPVAIPGSSDFTEFMYPVNPLTSLGLPSPATPW